MRVFWTALAILGALLVQSAISQIAPAHARVFDPFLLVVVYCGLNGGEVHGMLAGAAAGWVQDVHFGGRVLGLSALAKLLVGFAVGAGAARFLLAGPAARLLVVFVASAVEATLFQRLAAVFDVRAFELSLAGLLGRAALNAVVGALAFELVEKRRRRRRELRA